MNRRDRLMATLRGETVDRPPVCFYEINGLDELRQPDDPYNVFTDSSWAPLLVLARERTDRIVMRSVPFVGAPPDPLDELTTVETREENGSRFTRLTIRIGNHVLTSLRRRDRDVNTTWHIEHLLKGPEDARAWLQVLPPECGGEPDPSAALAAEQELGDSGIVMIDTADPLCLAAALFPLADYTVIAMTEPTLFRQMLDRFAALLWPRTEAIAKALPGRLWRIYGPEYASEPYLPPRLFEEYVVRYDRPMVEAIHRWGGFARIHSHGRLRGVLEHIAATGCMGLDPIEPPPQGDVQLACVRERFGKQLVLFGNLEASDIENLPEAEFGQRVARALAEGTQGEGRGFVLMPSSCPAGRSLSPRALRNYELMVEMAEGF